MILSLGDVLQPSKGAVFSELNRGGVVRGVGERGRWWRRWWWR